MSTYHHNLIYKLIVLSLVSIFSLSHAFAQDSSNLNYETQEMNMNFFNDKTAVYENKSEATSEDSELAKTQEIEYVQLTSQNPSQAPIGGFITANISSTWSLIIGLIILGLIVYAAIQVNLRK